MAAVDEMTNTRLLPKLPGLTPRDPRAPVAKKSQTLKFVNGYAVPIDKPKGDHSKPVVVPEELLGLDASESKSAGETLSVVPAWVAYDGKVLRFYSYYKESVTESREESYRIRKYVPPRATRTRARRAGSRSGSPPFVWGWSRPPCPVEKTGPRTDRGAAPARG